jgi:hypothetical protein
MDEISTRSGAAPAAHSSSKDAFAPDQNRPATLTASPDAADGKSWRVDSLGKIGDTLSELRGQAVDHVTTHVREKPLLAVAVTGVIFLAVGLLLGKR